MAKTKIPALQIVPTTYFSIDLDKIDITELRMRYRLFCYEIPDKFNHMHGDTKFAQLHNAYQQALEYPYYFFSKQTPPTIYFLVNKEKPQKEPSSLKLAFLSCEVLAKELDIASLCVENHLSILAKLFCASAFYHSKKAHRVCKGQVYIHSKKQIGKNIALQVEVRSVPHSKHAFYLNTRATYLKKMNKKAEKLSPEELKKQEDMHYLNTYCELGEGSDIYYRQIKIADVKLWFNKKDDKKDIYSIVEPSFSKRLGWDRPALPWDASNEERKFSRNYLLQQFQNKLIKHYNEKLSKDCAVAQKREMVKIEPIKGGSANLFLKRLSVVGIYDNRFKGDDHKNKISIIDYVSFFNSYYSIEGNVKFVYMSDEDLSETNYPILMLQDFEKDCFEVGGFLHGYPDTKQSLYAAFAASIPLQTLNVNPNAASEYTNLADYLNYGMLDEPFKHLNLQTTLTLDAIKEACKSPKLEGGKEPEEAKKRRIAAKEHYDWITNKISVCLNELLLKYYLIHELPINGTSQYAYEDALPCVKALPSLLQFAYMYENHFMYFDHHNILRFINLNFKQGKVERNDYLKNWGIDWDTIEINFNARNYKWLKEGEDLSETKRTKLKNTHFVFSKDLALAIEDTEEMVLHKTDPSKLNESQRATEYITALTNIHYAEKDELYTTGYKGALKRSVPRSVKIKKLYYYQCPNNFDVQLLLQTLAVEFVRNQQYTVYPYFFDLLNLYREDIAKYLPQSAN